MSVVTRAEWATKLGSKHASAMASIAAFAPQSRNAHQPMRTRSKAPIDKLGRRANRSI